MVPLVDDVAYDLAPIRDAMAHFAVNDAVVRSLASVALYALVVLELQLNEREREREKTMIQLTSNMISMRNAKN